jgi:DNA-binding beta-propeller fold protein YncE
MKIEQRIKRDLHSQLSTIVPAEDAWISIQRRVQRHERMSRLHAPLVAVFALLLSGVTLIILWLAMGRGSTGRPGSTGPLETSIAPHVSSTLNVAPEGGSSILFAEGSLWVLGYGPAGGDDPEAFRVDPATNSVVASTQLVAGPVWEVGGDGIASGEGSIWVGGGNGEDAVLQRIDPTSNAVVATVPLVGGLAGDVAVGSGAVWVSVMNTHDGTVHVARVDPRTNEVVSTIPLQGDWAREVFAEGETVIVHTRAGDASLLSVIDPMTNEVVTKERFTEVLGPFAESEGVIWAASNDRFLRIDPATGRQIGEPVPLQGVAITPLNSGTSMISDGGGIWFVGYDPDEANALPTLHRYDPDVEQVDVSVELKKPEPIALGIGGEALWVLNYDGSVTRVDL